MSLGSDPRRSKGNSGRRGRSTRRSTGVEAVCLKAMASSQMIAMPAKALADDIERWMADEPVAAWREPWARGRGGGPGRNRTTVTAAGHAVLVALIGTAAVLAVQTRASAHLRAANADLALANDKVTRANNDLAASNRRERARFELAQEAIRMFHTGVSEDLLLKQKEFGGFRTKLLRRHRSSIASWKRLLGGQADRGSRLGLGRALLRGGRAHPRVDSTKDAWRCTNAPWPCSKTWRTRPYRRGAAERGRKEPRCLALVLSWLGENAESLAAAERAATIAQDLAAADPTDIGLRGELAQAEHNFWRIHPASSRRRRGDRAAEVGTGHPGGTGQEQSIG